MSSNGFSASNNLSTSHRLYESHYFVMRMYNAIVFHIALGSPYKFHVDTQASGCLTAYGPGLSAGKTGEACVFTISTKGAEVPLLSLSVEGPSKAKVSYNHKLMQQYFCFVDLSDSDRNLIIVKILCYLLAG